MRQAAFLATTVALLMIWQAKAFDADVRITHDGPVVLGGSITFRADLLYSDGTRPSGKFKYTWNDNALDHHTYETGTTANTTTFYTVSYPAPKYHVGTYTMEVVVCKWFINLFCSEYTSNRVSFRVSHLLNGNLTIDQSNKTVTNKFVSSAEIAKFKANLREGDLDYIMKAATSISTYWFIDCKFYNQTSDFRLNYNFTQTNTFHTIQALVVADFEPPSTTTVAPTTTSTTPSPTPSNTTTWIPANSNTTTTTTTTSTTTITTSTTTSHSPISNLSNETVPLGNITFPFVCGSIIEPEPNKTYGYFEREVNVRAPISKLDIEGSTWIQPWNSLSLSVSCNGTGPFHKCVEIHVGKYNVTGNETCSHDSETLDTCKFSLSHYFLDAQEYTILIILSNDVSTEIHPVAVNIYKFTPKPQLSVIVVPVSCSLVAVVLVVFGIAYYVQSRSRFTVEVADFDFGQSSADMEYKTFRERLRDSFNNAGYKQLNSAKESQ